MFHELIYNAEINQKSWLERESNSHLRVTGLLLYQLIYRVNREMYSHFIQLKCTRDSRDSLALNIRDDVQYFDFISESS